ncbi:MAG: hypothetical protein KC731_26855 [Myxococcales bacterium]|nr:hypothetical protein [Myxococcales bacterium]
MTLPIYRGGSLPDEFLLLPTPGNCGRSVQVTYVWDEAENSMRLRLQGKGVLEPYPDVDRTEGVDFFTNPFWPEAIDFEDGRYQFWTISTPDVATFYYDQQTLQLLGSEYDFPGPPPPNTIPVQIPVFAALPTPFFQPEPNGDLDLVVEYDYDHLVRPDRPDLAHTVGTFLPHSLCSAHPFRYDLSSTRPWAKTLPASHAKSFREYLENGLIFDMTVEPPTPATDPPLTTMAGVYQGATALPGGVPKGWTLDLEAVFGGTAPAIIPLPSAPYQGESCVAWYKPKRDRDFNICGGMP